MKGFFRFFLFFLVLVTLHSYKSHQEFADQNHRLLSSSSSSSTTQANSKTDLNQKCIPFRNKTLIDIEDMYSRNITLLLSYPGSGNTWVRLLVESVTGILTGSVYTKDESLEQVFEGENRCGLRLSAIKGHPFSFDPCGEYLCLTNGPKDSISKCKRGMIPNFKKFIFVARSPIKSFIAEFQRFLTNSHNGTGIQRLGRYTIARFKGTCRMLAQELSYGWDNKVYPMMQRHSPHNFLVLKYENLVNKSTRMDELRRVPAFLGFPVSEDRLECAFALSESDSVHRKSSITLESFKTNEDFKFQCTIWNKIKYMSGNFSYPNPWPDMNCTGVEL